MNTDDRSGASAPTRALAAFAFGTHSQIADTSRPLAWLSPDEMDIDLSDPLQRRFGDYELVERIGQGGMGVVYRARQLGLERDVAFKLLAAGPWASEEFVERFRREARSAARMQHPNIVEIYEFGHRDGLNYFSMRLVEGQSLAERLAGKGPLEPCNAARLLRTLAEAMDYAHRLGVLHLDLKPGNVLLTPAGEPLIADFGLARRIDAGHEGGEIAGTPSYMAPEQAVLESHPLSASTDIWGLGAVLYECLTGRPPFLAPDAQRTLQRVVADCPAPPRDSNRAIPADLEAICLKCLEKDPAQRYASARELGEDLRRQLAGEPVSAREPSAWERTRRWVHRNRAASGLFAVVMIGILSSTWQAYRADEARTLAETRRVEAEAAMHEAQTQRNLAEAHSQRLRHSAAMMAALFPTDETQLEALRNRNEAAGRAVDWLQARLPGDEIAQAEILRAFLEALMDGGKQDAAHNFIYHISIRLGADYYREVLRTLLARDEPDSAIAAMLIANRLAPGTGLLAETVAVALKVAPSNPESLFVAELLCGNLEPPESCPDADFAQRLVEQEPHNAANWVLLAPRVAQDTARLRQVISRAATAPNYDDRFGRLLSLTREAPARSGVPLPPVLAELARIVQPNTEPEIAFGYLRFWDIPVINYRTVAQVCKPQQGSELQPALRADCLQLGLRLARSQSGLVSNMLGAIIAMRQSRGTAIWDEMLQLRRLYQWSRASLIDREDVEDDRLSLPPDYVRDLEEFGELEAMLRRLDRLGIPRQPPSDWQPPRPEMLLPEEDRASFLKAREAG